MADLLAEPGNVTVGCPFCFRAKGTCCRCGGTKRVAFTWNLLAWSWNVHGCHCDTCNMLRAERERLMEATRPTPEPPTLNLPPGPLPASGRGSWAQYPACAYCGKRGPDVERLELTWLHRDPCRAAFNTVQQRKVVNG